MRQVQIQVRRERSAQVMELAREHDAQSPVALPAEQVDGEEWSLVLVNLPNDRVGGLVHAVRKHAEEAQFILFPQGVLPLESPLGEVSQEVRSVAPLTTLELVVASLQSVGSWRAMLLYALFSGVIAAYAVIFEASYLLVAAMLIAPVGAPVMVSVISAATGDGRTLARGALRFLAAIAVLVGSAAVLGLAYGLRAASGMMEQVTSLSAWTVALTLAAGAAGAQSQVVSERASLVSGTVAGFLVAAALSPTAAVLGLSLVLQRWDYTLLMSFQLALQYATLVTGGWLLLRLFKVHPGDPSLGRGSYRTRNLATAALAVAMVGLVIAQHQLSHTFRKADVARRAVELAQEAVRAVPTALLVEANANFTHARLERVPGETLLVRLVLERAADAPSDSVVAATVRRSVEEHLGRQLSGVTPFVQISLLPSRRAP